MGVSVHDVASREWDVVVIGGGNAGLTSAIVAAELGRSVLLLEAAPWHLRAGNTRHTRNIRCAHLEGDSYTPGTYLVDEMIDDLRSVSGSLENPELAKLAVSESQTLPAWMTRHGVRWQPPLRGTIALERTNRFFLGGGKALANQYYAAAERAGVIVSYEAPVSGFSCDRDRVEPIVCAGATGEPIQIRSQAVIAASGGFEANQARLQQYWGPAAQNFHVRGSSHNDGAVLTSLISLGAATRGDPKGFHAVAVDARSPKFDGGIATRNDCIPFGIVVNREARRFADEGRDLWPKRYASWGGLIAEQPGQIAFVIVDSATVGRFIPPVYPAIRADTTTDLATGLGLQADALSHTIDDFNAHVGPESDLDLRRLDGVRTDGLEVPKSNWARRLDRPPYFAFPLAVGITFTYLGVSINPRGEVLDRRGLPLRNVFAAGEIMAGNILKSGYLAGFGMTIGGVFGRIAGREAASIAI